VGSTLQDVQERCGEIVDWIAVVAMMISCLAYPSTLKMESVRYSETLVEFYRGAQRHISGEGSSGPK
jgi:hypothetical protein